MARKWVKSLIIALISLSFFFSSASSYAQESLRTVKRTQKDILIGRHKELEKIRRVNIRRRRQVAVEKRKKRREVRKKRKGLLVEKKR